jgi:non-ribosomal peptide synthase protein (TIGR01720 family)
MFALNPGQRVEYVALLNELSTAGMRPQKIVHMWNVTRDDLVAPADYAQDLGFYGPLLLAQALGIRNFTDELRLTVVSNQAHEAVPGDNLRPEKATLLGALKVIPQEYPNIVCRSVDLALPEPGGWQERKLVSQLLAELSQNSEDRVIAYRGRQRLVQAFEPIRLEKATQASSLLRAGGVYLIFDGLQGIGLTLAEHLARTIQARLALTKSPETTVAKPTRLADMADVLVIDVDVTDRAQVSSAVAQAEERFGRLNGVIYTGNFGQAPLRSIREIDKAECEQQLQAAVHGLPMLAQVLAEKELDFCLLTSSLSSILGGPGLAAYAATNSFIDAFAHQSNRASATPWISVNWDGWRFEQDHTDNTPFIAHTDELAITPPEGMEAFERILSVGDVGQVAVSTVDLQARIDRWVRLESVQTTSKSPGKTTALHARPNLLVPYVAPRDKTEQVLANVWQELIGIEKVGIYDNFVELGGDSLIGVQIIARANEAGLRLTPQQLFQHQTIAELAAVEGDIVVQAEQGIVTGPAPLTVSQHWFFSHEFVDLHRWNATTLFEVPPDMNPALTERVVKYMLDHHDALRARFTYEGTKWQQTIVAPDQIGSAPFMCIDLSGLPVAEHATALERAADKLQGSLNLSEGPLFRVALFNLGADRRGRLLIVAHHLVLDGPSRSILMEDFQTAYRQLSHGEPVRLPPKTTSLKQWSEQVSAYAQSEDLRQEMGYWLNLPWEQVLLLPTDFPEGRNHNTWASLSSVLLRLSVDETDVLLREVPKIYNAQVLDALLMALAQAVTQWTGGRCMAVRAVDTGRQLIPTADNVDLSRTVGWLSLTRGIVLERAEMDDPGEALKSIRDQLRHAPNRGLGYEVLLFCSNDTEIAERLKNLPIFDLDFNYVSQQEGELVGTDLLAPSLEFVGDWQNPRNKSAYLLTCQVFIAGGRLVARWMYSENAHKRATINKVARDFIEVLRALVVHCQSGSTDGGQSRLITEKP